MERRACLRSALLAVCICSQVVVSAQSKNADIRLALTGEIPSGTVSSFHAGINIIIKNNVQQKENLMNRYDPNPIFGPVLKPDPDLNTFLMRGINDYLVKIGFEINPAGFTLNATVQQYEINFLSGNGWTGSVKINWRLIGTSQEELFSQSAMGFFKSTGSAENFDQATNAINTAFYRAMSLTDWEGMARAASRAAPTYRPQQTNNVQANNTRTNTQDNIKDNTRVTSNPTTNTTSPAVASDIDVNIPVTYQKNENTFAVVIGNENYDNEIQVKYAINDAGTFYEYAIKTLGIPKENIHLSENATFGKMLGEIDWLKSVARAYQGKAKLLFYYAGHGMPDESTKSAYLLPTDGNASTIRTAIKVDELYAALTEYPVAQATVFLDACFSGASRDGMLTSGRGVRIMPKSETPKGNLIIFTAVTGDETAHPYTEKQHGLFSYFLMKKLQESRGDISFQSLSSYITTNVNQHSVVGGKEQNPTVIISPTLLPTWQNLKLK
jgi:hypothetical protein